jgi:PAS domain-containing protein
MRKLRLPGGDVVSFSVDITRGKMGEIALAESEGRLRDVLEMAPVGIWKLDQRGQTIFANRRLMGLFGDASPSALAGSGLALTSGGDAQGPFGFATRGENEAQIQLPGQPPRRLLISASPWVRDALGQPSCVLSLLDVTPLKAAQERIEQLIERDALTGLANRATFRAALDAMAGDPRGGALLLVDLDQFKAALRPDTILVSVMLVNNEIGVIQDIPSIGTLCRERGIIFHVDAAQATGKVAIDLATLPVDLMSLASHKTYGPKGIGALYVRRKPRVRLEAQMHGGGHERGMRSGTLPTHQIVGMGTAFAIARQEMVAESERIRALHTKLVSGLTDIEQVFINGDMQHRVPHNLNISFNYVEGESLIMGVKGLAVSSGSACTSASLEPSYVLRALGRSDELAHSSLRMTIGRWTTEAEIDYAVETIKFHVAKLRDLSPLWDMYQEGIDISTIQWAAH